MAPIEMSRRRYQPNHSAILRPSNSSCLQLLMPQPLRISKPPLYFQRYSRRSSQYSVDSSAASDRDGRCDKSLSQHKRTHPLLAHAHAALPSTALTLPSLPSTTPKREVSSTSTDYYTCPSHCSPPLLPSPPPSPSPAPPAPPIISQGHLSKSAVGVASNTCASCHQSLENSARYAFPATAPLILHSVTRLLATTSPNTNHTPLPYPASNKQQLPYFCLPCFTHLASLHLCWTCGDPIIRPEERVFCGWARWHWSCTACLICRTPVKPPPWIQGEMRLDESPGCDRCRRWIGEMMVKPEASGTDIETRQPEKKGLVEAGQRTEESKAVGEERNSKRPKVVTIVAREDFKGTELKPIKNTITQHMKIQASFDRKSLSGLITPPPSPSPTPIRRNQAALGSGRGSRSGQRIPTRAVNEIIAGFELGLPMPLDSFERPRERRASPAWWGTTTIGSGAKQPPLPKWMEKLPGNVRRKRGFDDISGDVGRLGALL